MSKVIDGILKEYTEQDFAEDVQTLKTLSHDFCVSKEVTEDLFSLLERFPIAHFKELERFMLQYTEDPVSKAENIIECLLDVAGFDFEKIPVYNVISQKKGQVAYPKLTLNELLNLVGVSL